MGDPVRDDLGHLPAGRAAAVALDRRPPRARDGAAAHPLRTPALIQLTFALLFLVIALALRDQIVDNAFGGSEALYWILVGSTLAYAASYFARGYLAGHQWFALYGGLVLFESVARFMFPVAVAVGIASGQTAVALGILAAPFASLLVVPWALRRHLARRRDRRRRRRRGARVGRVRGHRSRRSSSPSRR